MRQILKAANASPVGLGQYETMHLTVITNSGILAKIDKVSAEFMHREGVHPLYGAPVLILVSTKNAPNMESIAFSNASIMVHNMALAATELALGSCYIWGAVPAISNSPELMRELDIPENFVLRCGLVLGKTEEHYSLRNIPENRVTINEIR